MFITYFKYNLNYFFSKNIFDYITQQIQNELETVQKTQM